MKSIIAMIIGTLLFIIGIANDSTALAVIGGILSVGSIILGIYEKLTSGDDTDHTQAMIGIGFIVFVIFIILFVVLLELPGVIFS